MLFPHGGTIPSEGTVEVLTNHFILQELKDPSAYIFCPTRNEEVDLGFDARLQGSKLAVIQYKRVRSLNKDGSVSVAIDVDQHKTLRSKFPRSTRPYVFYCFSSYPDYASIHNDFVKMGMPPTRLRSHLFFWQSLLFDAWDIPVGSTLVKFSNAGTLKAQIGHSPRSGPIPYHRGPVFVKGFISCQLGELSYQLADRTTITEDLPRSSLRRVSVLRSQGDSER
jgi:hypothetical protein